MSNQDALNVLIDMCAELCVCKDDEDRFDLAVRSLREVGALSSEELEDNPHFDTLEDLSDSLASNNGAPWFSLGRIEQGAAEDMVGQDSPWGEIQQASVIGIGIVVVDTASHGGIHLTPQRQRQMPANMRQEWYETDCEVPHVLQRFWREVKPNMRAMKWNILKGSVDAMCEHYPWKGQGLSR